MPRRADSLSYNAREARWLAVCLPSTGGEELLLKGIPAARAIACGALARRLSSPSTTDCKARPWKRNVCRGCQGATTATFISSASLRSTRLSKGVTWAATSRDGWYLCTVLSMPVVWGEEGRKR